MRTEEGLSYDAETEDDFEQEEMENWVEGEDEDDAKEEEGDRGEGRVSVGRRLPKH